MRLPLLALSSLLALSGCLAESPNSDTAATESTSSFQVRVAAFVLAPVAARAVSADVGGKLFVEISNSLRGLSLKDSLLWSGSSEGLLDFPALPEGGGYAVKAWYRDPSGFTTHGDSVGGIRVGRGDSARARLALHALLGKVVLNAPSLPVSVDTLSMSWSCGTDARSTLAGRGTGGRTTLRLDSLAIGRPATLRLRAWSAAGDTLFHLDTTVVLSSDRDLPLALNLQSSRGQILASLGFLAGGELDATASFAGESEQPASQTGRLVLAAFSDSGAADWIGIRNTGAAFSGRVRLGKGSTDAQFDLDLPAGAFAVVTRAPCATVAASAHPLHAAEHLVCGIDEIVVTHSTSGGSLWKLRGADATELMDEVLVLDAKQSWPDLNTSTARTARLRSDWTSAQQNDAGRAWCVDGSDAPSAACP